MFYIPHVQQAFGFADDEIAFLSKVLSLSFGRLAVFERREPIWQLVRSLIGAQTYDAVAEQALERLMARWPYPRDLANAAPDDVLGAIRDVTHADRKAGNLVETMRRIRRERRDHDLSFLRSWPVRTALCWLERLPGVGPKVAAATLNASTLGMAVFIVDSHVHRVLLRFGFIGAHASAERARDAVTATRLDADALLELFAQMKRLGQTICRPFRARCTDCPLASRCQKRLELGVPDAQRNRVPQWPGGAYGRVIPRGDADRRLRGGREPPTRRT